MIPIKFPQATSQFGPPPGLAESQVGAIPVFTGVVQRGSLEGSPMVVTAWLPEPEDLERLNRGEPVFLTFLGGLPPHMASTDFERASCPE